MLCNVCANMKNTVSHKSTDTKKMVSHKGTGMMRLSLKNIQKSIKDYVVYFLTLIFGVAVFYMFNSIDSQQAMLQLNGDSREIVKVLVEMIGMVSVGVAVVLGFLIVYANNFLIKRRKKEFGLYMTLGMGKGAISRILLFETIWIGLFSLVIGLLVGVFGSQLMSVFVAKLFRADMSEYEFVFSMSAFQKTCLYFGLMYVAVMLFNTFTISRYKLIDLLTAIRKNEKVKMKNPVVCVIVFLVGVGMLVYAYYAVTAGFNQLNVGRIGKMIVIGIVATFLIFWSLSGFILKIARMQKGFYLRGTNMFVLRQMHNKINTTVVSMTVICLLLFMTISLLSSGLAMNEYITKGLEEMTPVDVCWFKQAEVVNVSENKFMKKDAKRTISETLQACDVEMDIFKDVVELKSYQVEELTYKQSLEEIQEEVKAQFPYMDYSAKEDIVKLSDYNKVAKLYGMPEYELQEDEYIVICDYDNMKKIRNTALQNKPVIHISGKDYKAKYDKCRDGYVSMSQAHMNIGIYIVPDSCPLEESDVELQYFIANYNADSDKEKSKIEHIVLEAENTINKKAGVELWNLATTKISIIDSSRGLTNTIIFVAIYLGFIFLIASAAILALKELTETSDNKDRYGILQKIGVDDKMLHQALFRQIGIFFIMPLILAIIHSVFGIQFAMKMLSITVKPEEILPSVVATAIFLLVIYGGYFIATYQQSKNIISDER